MTRTVFCRRHQKLLEGLAAPPFPGPDGEAVFENVSAQAWQEWLRFQTLLINERRLVVTDPKHRAFLAAQREKFLSGEKTAEIEGYIPPDSDEG